MGYEERKQKRNYHVRRALHHVKEARKRTNGVSSPESRARLTSARNDLRWIQEALE